VLAELHSERFWDTSPAAVWATLLDEGTYLCSQRTMYRILSAEGEVRERRDQRTHPVYAKPELLAQAPNETWTWDITKLKGPQQVDLLLPLRDPRPLQPLRRGLDGEHRESGEIAKALIAQAAEQQGVRPGTLTVHADRGSSMTSKPVAFLLSDLGITRTHNRPYTSTDNPYSESQFKTLKYRPGFPERFPSIEEARVFCREFFRWYDLEHRHGGIGLMTPHAVHYGRAPQIHKERARVLKEAYERTPERFVRFVPRPPDLPGPAWINKPATEEVAH